MTLPQLPNKFSTAIGINTASRKALSRQQMQRISDEEIDFIYGQAVSFMEIIHNGMKLISARAILLLGYLATLSGVSILSFFEEKWRVPFFEYISEDQFSSLVLIGYILTILAVVVGILKPSRAKPIYNEPMFFIRKNIFGNGIKMTKIIMIDHLQEGIDANYLRQSKVYFRLKLCISAIFVIPVSVFFILAILPLLQ